MNTFTLNVITPNDRFDVEGVTLLSAPTPDGTVGIMANHSALFTTLPIALVAAHRGNEVTMIAVSGGFLEVSGKNQVVLIANTAETADNIDIERAKAAVAREEKRVQEFQNSTKDLFQAEFNLQKQLARLNASKYKKG